MASKLSSFSQLKNNSTRFNLPGQGAKRYIIKKKGEPKKVLIHGAPFVITADQNNQVQVMQNTSISIEQGKIKDVYPVKQQDLTSGSFDLIYNASQKWGTVVTPGFINLHAHPPMYLLKSSLMMEDEAGDMENVLAGMAKMESKMDQNSFVISAIGDLTEQQKSGITTTLSHYGVFDPIEQAASLVRQRVINALSAKSNSHPQNTPQLVEKYLKDKAKYFTKPAIALHYLYKTDPALLKKIKKLQEKYKAIFTLHLAESTFGVKYCQEKFGMREIAVLDKFGLLNDRTIISHGVHLTPEEIRLIIHKKAGVAHLPTSNVIHQNGVFDYPTFYHKKGVDRIGLGTDSVISKSRLDLLTEAWQTRITHLERKLVQYPDLFKMMTINAARILHLDKVGMIAPGYQADLVFWKFKDRGFIPYDEKHPETIIGNMITHGGRAVRDLMIGGQFIISNRIHNLIDESKLLASLQKEHMKLRSKAKK